jgi:hypothetical protein
MLMALKKNQAKVDDPLHNSKIIKHLYKCDKENDNGELPQGAGETQCHLPFFAISVCYLPR